MPTFVVFKNGQYLEQYEGSKTSNGIYNRVVKANHGENTETECKNIAKMKKKTRQYTVVYFGPKDHPFYEGIYKPFFDYLQDDVQDHKSRIKLRHNNDPQCAQDNSVTIPSIMWYKHFDDKLQIYGAD